MNKFKVGNLVEIKESGKVGNIVHVFEGQRYPYLVSFDLSKFTFNGYREENETLTPYDYDDYLAVGDFHEFCREVELVLCTETQEQEQEQEVVELTTSQVWDMLIALNKVKRCDDDIATYGLSVYDVMSDELNTIEDLLINAMSNKMSKNVEIAEKENDLSNTYKRLYCMRDYILDYYRNNYTNSREFDKTHTFNEIKHTLWLDATDVLHYSDLSNMLYYQAEHIYFNILGMHEGELLDAIEEEFGHE